MWVTNQYISKVHKSLHAQLPCVDKRPEMWITMKRPVTVHEAGGRWKAGGTHDDKG